MPTLGTPITTVLDLALVSMRDYKIDQLYTKSQTDWLNYLQGFLSMAILEFDNCRQSLEIVEDSGTNYFVSTLTNQEIKILVYGIIYYFLNREINNTSQINLHLNDNDFKHYAESQNLDKKVSYRNNLYEQFKQALVDYGMNDTESWTNWNNGIFN